MNSKADRLDRPDRPIVPDIVQFCCQLYFAQEGESPLVIDIMRLGSLKGRCSVKYHTEDASALSGREFEACSGELIFEHGEDAKEISVVINDDDNWSPSTEFRVVLTHPQNCKLGQDLQQCRVKIIDDDAFPGNKHREEIEKGEDAIWNISGFSLFWEFFRLNFISEGMAWRTVLTICFDQMKNGYLMLTLVMKTYLINVVLDTSVSNERLIFPDRRLCAIVIGMLYILPLSILHVWDYYKLSLDVQGRTKMFIQTTLFRKYLNYSEKSRRSMTPAQMNHAITQESTDVASAYGAVLEVWRMSGRIALMVLFTLSQDPACWWVVALMPSLMILFGLCRGDAMSKVTRVSGTVREAVVAFVSECCDKYSLIAEYSRRPAMSDIFEKKANLARLSVIPEQQVALNNNYFPQWLGPTFIGAYIAIFAESVLDGSTSMGVFLAIISVISDMTNDFEGIFIELMSINTRIDSLKVLTHFFNMESELTILRKLNLRNRELSITARHEVLKLPEPPPETGLLRTDLIEMRIEGVSFGYTPTEKLLQNVGKLHVPLGKIVALVGVHGSGKNTFLRLVSSRLLPDEGEIFVPTHLRVLFVAQDPVLLDASIWENLTYGAPDNSDLSVVKGVLKMLDMKNILHHLQIEKAFAHIKGHGTYLGKKAFAHIKGHGSYLSQTPSPTSPSSVIDSKFANITGSGGYNPHDVKADATWQKCTAINWTKVAGEPTTEGKLNLPSIHMMLEELELQDHCACPGDWCNDDTCKAVFAAIEVFIELCASEFDPVFANFSVTTWGYYPSWVNGTVHGLDYADEMPVKVTLKHPKGVCGYAVCDLLRTILTQSANQMMTGTCSYVASLAALSKKAPARAIKIATRLFWLGEITPGLGPCPGILAQQPGLIPFKTQMGWKPSFYAGGSATCHGNSADCGHASGMPQQNIGLTFEWSQTLISKWMAINWGYCSNDTVRAGITWPGQSKADAAEATKNQGGWYNSMVWECQSLFDLSDTGSSSCRLVINPLT